MKKAFTLIELLVVIAIIAILAAILFPVFAQAKTAAKKAASISNQKQIGLAMFQYQADNDDIYPRNDDCQVNSSLNTDQNNYAAGANPNARCSGADSVHPYSYRMNHYSWQKWIMPYVKNVPLFFHPALGKDSTQWNSSGEIMNSYGINLALTGALNTWSASGKDPNTISNAFRDSFIGGSQTAIGDVASAWMVMEIVDPSINFSPTFLDNSGSTSRKTAYPLAIREAWATKFYPTDSHCNVTSTTPDPKKVPFSNSTNVSFADGHTKSMNVGDFLAKTPRAADYQVGSRPACGLGSGAWTTTKPVWSQPWPLWALQ